MLSLLDSFIAGLIVVDFIFYIRTWYLLIRYVFKL
jgi:hypothetical protein